MIFITNLFHLTAGRYCACNSDVYLRTSCFRSLDVYPLTGEQRVIAFCEGTLRKERNLSAVKLVSTEKIKSGRGEQKLAKKQGLAWKSRLLLFQSSLWKSGKKQKEQK